MGKSILELFKKEDVKNFNVPGVPAVGRGKTAKEKYDIRNSKDINLRVASPLINFPLFALNGLRKLGERKNESFIEEELIGIRALRGLASPIIYGSDIIRLKLQSTPTLESMKDDPQNDQNPSKKRPLSKFGQQIKDTRDQFRKFVGIPGPLNPSSIRLDLKDTNTFDTMIKLASIKKDRAGSALGKLLQQSAGGASTVGRQVIGNALSQGKKALRDRIYNTGAKLTENEKEVKPIEWNDKNRLPNNRFNREASKTILYSQFEKYSGAKSEVRFGKAGSSVESDTRWISLRQLRNNPEMYHSATLGGDFWRESLEGNDNTYHITPTKSNTIGEKRNLLYVGSEWVNESERIKRYHFYLRDNTTPYTGIKTNNDGKTAIGASKQLEESDTKKTNLLTTNTESGVLIGFNANGIEKVVDIENLRPGKLKNKKGTDLPKYSDGRGLNADNVTKTLYSNLATDSLEKKRGLTSRNDALNQLGVIPRQKLNSLNYNGTALKDLDLVPLRFQFAGGDAIYMRSTISSFSETFSPSWDSSNFVGNPFSFYTYTKIERKVAFNIKAYAMSQLELVMMWERLNFLAKTTYPVGSSNVAVTPPIIYFTLGSLYIDKPVIVTSLSFGIDDAEQLWETSTGNLKIRSQNETLSEKLGKVKFKTFRQNDGLPSMNNEDIQNYPSYEVGKPVADINWKRNDINTQESTDYNMDYWKVPKFIDVQIELTFLESIGSTSGKLYSFGKPVSNGGTRKPGKSKGSKKANTDQAYSDESLAAISKINDELRTAAANLEAKQEELALAQQENQIRASEPNKQIADKKVARAKEINTQQKLLRKALA